jgi:hypothetical protein
MQLICHPGVTTLVKAHSIDDSRYVPCNESDTRERVQPSLTEEMRNATAETLMPHMAGLRYLHCIGRKGTWDTGMAV